MTKYMYDRVVNVTLVNGTEFCYNVKVESDKDIYNLLNDIIQGGIAKVDRDHVTLYTLTQIAKVDIDLIPEQLIKPILN